MRDCGAVFLIFAEQWRCSGSGQAVPPLTPPPGGQEAAGAACRVLAPAALCCSSASSLLQLLLRRRFFSCITSRLCAAATASPAPPQDPAAVALLPSPTKPHQAPPHRVAFSEHNWSASWRARHRLKCQNNNQRNQQVCVFHCKKTFGLSSIPLNWVKWLLFLSAEDEEV